MKLGLNIQDLPNYLAGEELKSLFYKMAKGDLNAREKIIIHNLRLVIYEINNSFKYLNMDEEEMFSIGVEGLIKAVDTFKVEKGYKFSTYAIKCIDNEILYYYRKSLKNRFLISLDEYFFEKRPDLKGRYAFSTLKDTLQSETNLEKEYIKKEIIHNIRLVVNELPDFEKKIIKLYFGFYDDKLYTQSEIANLLSISQAHVCRTIKRVLKLISIMLKDNNIVDINGTKSSRLSKQI